MHHVFFVFFFYSFEQILVDLLSPIGGKEEWNGTSSVLPQIEQFTETIVKNVQAQNGENTTEQQENRNVVLKQKLCSVNQKNQIYTAERIKTRRSACHSLKRRKHIAAPRPSCALFTKIK